MRIDSEEWNKEMERQRQETNEGFGVITWLAGLMAFGATFLIWYVEHAS